MFFRARLYRYVLLPLGVVIGFWMGGILAARYMPGSPYFSGTDIPERDRSIAIAFGFVAGVWSLAQFWMVKNYDNVPGCLWSIYGLVALLLMTGQILVAYYLYNVYHVFSGLVYEMSGDIAEKFPVLFGAVLWFLAFALCIWNCAKPSGGY